MQRILWMLLDAAVASVVLIPLFYWLNKRYYQNPGKTVCYFLFAFYLSAVYEVVGLPDVTYVRFHPNTNLIPFAYMFSDHTGSLLNVALFFPLGAMLPLFWRYFHPFYRTVLFGIGTSLLIEILQLFTYRATDVNDLITNTLGTAAGWLAAKLILRLFPGIRSSSHGAEAFTVYWGAFAVMFFVQPLLMNILI